MPSLLPLLIVVHVVLALSLFVPSLLLPFALRRAGSGRASTTPPGPRRPFVRTLLAIQANGTVPIALGLGLTGLGLVGALGASLLAQPWLLVALVIYALNLGLAFFVQRPNLRRLIAQRTGLDEATLASGARRQRYLSYLMAALIGAIGFLMSTKPRLW